MGPMIPRLSPLALLAIATAAHAGDPAPAGSPPEIRLVSNGQPEAEPTLDPPAPRDHRRQYKFGDENSQWLTFGLGYAHDFADDNDYNIHAAWSQFLIKDVEFALEAHAWYFDQAAENAFGLNPALNFRWHFFNNQKWTAYADLGIGLLIATDTVPQGATQFGFMPRGGFGLTYQISDRDQTRLQAGLRWHHISNARITGDSRNPGRDAPFLYAGVVLPF
jgi:hypothetical protein